MTENQKDAFGFSGKNSVWSEVLKVIEQLQEQHWMLAISKDCKGEDRIHAAGQADGINLLLSTLIELRKQARELNGLTTNEDLA
ncbi:hypothetical protein UFOVP811_5 [uncultured Caudovirales phage]|jgi:hypothetical protein|uniref:Uncharacterized protein n=1 Tax=uncultured Caudovirales phage TaxID=2100421 RepID=A0A6J5NWC1_9CAUD|nr:hypothetical protein UFOVP811_5 [uncultured Caudovirales phage]